MSDCNGECRADEPGELTLKVSDPEGRTWEVSMPYPEDGDVPGALRQLTRRWNCCAGSPDELSRRRPCGRYGQPMTSTAPVYALIHPDGRAEWGDDIATASKALGPHGISRAFLTPGSRLRIAMSDCALIMPEEYAPNPYAAAALHRVAGLPVEQAPETRGPVILFGWDPDNEWDGTRPLDPGERAVIERALNFAGCTAS